MAPALQYRMATQRPRVPAARAGGGHAGIADAPTPSEPDWVSTARRHAPLKFCPDHSMGAGQCRAGDLRQYPKIPALPALLEHRRGDDDVLRRAAGWGDRADAAGGCRPGPAAAG